MHGMRRGLGWLFAGAILAMSSVGAAGATKSSHRLPPPCRAGAVPGAQPPDACVHVSYRSDKYTTRLLPRGLTVSHWIHHNGQFSYVVLRVKVGFSDALAECPAGGVPVSDIPCQQGSAGIRMTGRYVPRKRHLDPGAYGYPNQCTPQATHGTCVVEFKLFEDQVPGFYAGVIQVGVQELTKNPANDLGSAGFEFAVGVNVPRPPKA